MYVFTSGTIQNHPAIRELIRSSFKRVLSAEELEVSKTDSASYVEVARRVHHRTDEVLYVDDKQSNLDSAAAAGMIGVLFSDNPATIQKIDALLRRG